MVVQIKGNKLVIEIEMEKVPRPSKSAKTLVVATTGGFKITDAEVNGRKVSVSINATTAAQ